MGETLLKTLINFRAFVVEADDVDDDDPVLMLVPELLGV